jgi:hypothetical protein
MLKVPPQYLVVNDFLSVYSKSLTRELPSDADPSRIIHLRCSQLPLCVSSLILEYKLKGLKRTMDMMMAYYVTVGSAVHEVMQHYLSRSGRFLADYYCPECHTYYPLSHQHTCCGKPTIYDEVNIAYASILGHIDAIFQDSRGHYWILDFKTCSVSGAAKKKTSPGDAYMEQVESYALLLYRQYGIKVRGVILCFIPRDNPRTPSLWVRALEKINFQQIQNRLKAHRALHRQAIEVETEKEVYSLVSKHRCSNPYCKYCKLDLRTLRMIVKKAFATKHKLPISSLEVPEKPAGTIVIHRNNPGPHISERIELGSWKLNNATKALLVEEITARIKEINKRTRRLPDVNDE